MKTELLNFIDNKIDGCTELGGMDKEKWAFIQVKKFINSQRSNETKAVRQNEQTQEVCVRCKMRLSVEYRLCQECYDNEPIINTKV